ncbi:glucose 1-dehydrogenase [Oceanobacillus piezotolerans]|uniref:Glucose 1-dehydrogenase n=1 Tax=Oceanobacillus piezotolerans TaxID=2448030 RepID=A0A498DBL9_9BACI|nr:glucose 1-dehydrogenase [Oceanobacillus piezotolerans]RLL47084.1 glucose 1-dehydrogenase [Oceanobacillus piezotolerans]
MSFEDKVVLITGAAGGIGLATAKSFAKEGAKLALVDLNQETLEKAASTIDATDVLTLTANVAKEEEAKAYVEKTKEHYGRIDVFINNAGINGDYQFITDITEENIKKVLDVNVMGVFFGLKYVLQVMKEQKSGAVVNTASNGGWLGAPGMSAYVASKHAVVGITKSAALEGAQYGVRVNAVAPTAVDTDMMKRIESNTNPEDAAAAKKAIEASIPMGRYSTPEEIADLMVFLSSDKASFISGTYYRIDGGQSSTSA